MDRKIYNIAEFKFILYIYAFLSFQVRKVFLFLGGNILSDVLMYFEKGGLVMYPLLICSLVIIFIAIERYLFYKSIDSGHLFTKQYCDILSGETLEKAFEFAKTHKGACANILTQASPLPTVERTEAFMEMKGNIVNVSFT